MQLVVCSYDILCRHFWKFVEMQDRTVKVRFQGRSQTKLMTEAMSMEDLWLRQSVHGWVLFQGVFQGIKSVYSDKSERNYRRLACY